MKKKLKYLALGLVTYLLLGNLLHKVIFPEDELAETIRPKSGFKIQNRLGEKAIFRVTSLESKGMNIEFEFLLTPGGTVPVYHIHEGISETFAVKKGTLIIRMPDGEHKITAGESKTVPADTPHQPRNDSNETVETMVTYSPGGRMDEFLTQYWGLVDDHVTGTKGEAPFLQMMLFSPKFGIYLAEPPIFVQKLVSVFLAPIARIVGYKSTYPKYFQ